MLKCLHRFCENCLKSIFEHEVQEFKCPLCRKALPIMSKFLIDNNLEALIKKEFPEEYFLQEKILASVKEKEDEIKKVQLIYGNTHNLLKDGKPLRSNPSLINNHEWTFFVRTADKNMDIKKFIKKIEVILDPSFGDVTVDLRNFPFEMKGVGYGEFTLSFKIYWQSWLKMQASSIDHQLSFQPKGKSSAYVLKYDKSLESNIKF